MHACRRVLVVNDDPLVRDSLVEALDHEGVEVRAAASAEEAAGILDGGFRPDVVLLDLNLGVWGADGEGFLAWLRGTAEHDRVPVVAISASPWRLRRVEDEVHASLEVPFSLEELERTLSEICGEVAA